MKIIVAVDANWGIGYKGDLLEKIPEDLKYFKEKTLGKVVVMGRETFDSLPGKSPLKNRVNIVLSRNEIFEDDRITICRSMDELFKETEKYHTDDIFIIGGEMIYKQFLPYCNEAYITKIEKTHVADKFFPKINEFENWELAYSDKIKNYNKVEYNFTKYINKSK